MDSLSRLGLALRSRGYEFVAPTPETHRRVLRNSPGPARTLRDVFGWGKTFDPALLDAELRELALPLLAGGRSTVRFSSLGKLLCAHSAYPTVEPDAVFFGPDSYRFCALLEARVEKARSVADVGTGTGVGGILLRDRAERVQLLDVNQRALRFSSANCELNGKECAVIESDVLASAEGPLDLVVANPPYLADDGGRAYRDGGGELGTGLSARIVEEALDRLDPAGRVLLYTATPVVEGRHLLWPLLEPLLRKTRFDYRELDPDVFGEELDRPAYSAIERIAVVALDAVKL